MLVKVSRATCSSSDGIKITRVWANDGWCYIPELKIRQLFSNPNNTSNTISIKTEGWLGAIPSPCHIETGITHIDIADKPMIWEEMSDYVSERYEEVQ